MIKKINIIFLLIISFFLCTSVFSDEHKTDDDLFKKCLENIDLPECKEILPFKLGGGSPNEFDIFRHQDHEIFFDGFTIELGQTLWEW